MKTAISIPEDVFREAEELARRMKRSRSDLYTKALREYLGRHLPDRLTDAMNNALSQIPEQSDPFVKRAATRTLKRHQW